MSFLISYNNEDQCLHCLLLIFKIQAPPSEVQDKVSFIMNNVSAANIESKAKEFTEILSLQYYPWFAQYMVMKRYLYSSCFI